MPKVDSLQSQSCKYIFNDLYSLLTRQPQPFRPRIWSDGENYCQPSSWQGEEGSWYCVSFKWSLKEKTVGKVEGKVMSSKITCS